MTARRLELHDEARRELREAFDWYAAIQVIAVAHHKRRPGYWLGR